MNLDHTVRGRVASYVWGPDVGSRWLGQASWQQAGGVGGLLMVIDGVATSQHSGTTTDPIDDDYVDSLAPHARLALRAAVGGLPRLPPVALVPLMDRMGNVTGYKKAHTSVPAAQLDAIYDYDAFGNEIRSTGPAADIVPYHFSTKRVDSTTGLVYYGYRWYDPGKGRWTSRDPIGEAGGENLSGFVKNRAVGLMDVLGRKERKLSNCTSMTRAVGFGFENQKLYKSVKKSTEILKKIPKIGVNPFGDQKGSLEEIITTCDECCDNGRKGHYKEITTQGKYELSAGVVIGASSNSWLISGWIGGKFEIKFSISAGNSGIVSECDGGEDVSIPFQFTVSGAAEGGGEMEAFGGTKFLSLKLGGEISGAVSVNRLCRRSGECSWEDSGDIEYDGSVYIEGSFAGSSFKKFLVD